MKIIEITGVAGVGKSYILNKLLEKKKYTISDMEIIRRYHITDIYLFYLFFRSENSLKLFRIILDITKELNMSLFDKINFVRNTMKKVGKQRYLSHIDFVDDRVVLVDEGISHIYQNIVTGKTQNNLKILILLNKFISLIKLPDEVIVIDAPTPLIVERLKERGHKRLRGCKDIERFVENSKRNLSIIGKKFPKIKTFINKE
ncbi:MAG: hypothetical protein KAU90_02895 [Sulfurovaceae bacterium]|nr:hypothetical protein [Sulfurovaceae bacterium]